MSLEHLAFFYGDTDDFLAVAVPYLRAGLEREQAVLAVVQEPNLTALRDVMARDGKTIQFFDSVGFYQHPVHTLRDYQNLVKQCMPQSICAVAEPVWKGLNERQTLEWIRYESLINVVFDGSGARALCPYDRARLAPEIVERAQQTHPRLLQNGRSGGNDEYVDPMKFGAGCDRTQCFDRPEGAEYFAIENDDLHALRGFVAERALRHGLARQPAQSLVTAANEVAANALQHGVPPMGLWMWQTGDDLVCEIGDHGFWRPSPLTGFIPPDSALQRGFGLWSVRLLVDLVELRGGWDGTFVRLHVRR